MDCGGRELSSMNDIFVAFVKEGRSFFGALFAVSGEGRSASEILDSAKRPLRRKLNSSRPMHAGVGSVLALSFVTGGLLLGAFSGGHGPVVLSSAAKAVGLTATDIIITGQVETTEADVLSVLPLTETRSLVGFDANDARESILQLPWVKEATLRKLYPGKLLVSIKEKTAFAVWQHGDELSVVEQNGDLISRFGISDLMSNRFGHLPHLVGEGAAKSASQILPLFASHPRLANLARAYVRVADRRWDVKMQGGVRIKLPEHGLRSAVSKIANMEAAHQILGRQISTLDLRLEDRLIVQLSPDAAIERAKFVAARLKSFKKAEQQL